MKRTPSLLTPIAILALLGGPAMALAAGNWQIQGHAPRNGGAHHGHGNGGGGPPAPGPTGAVQDLTLSNLGSVPLDHINIRFRGADSRDFSQNNNCGRSVGGGGSCVISVTFRPHTPGPKSATMEIFTSGGSKAVDLAGTGT